MKIAVDISQIVYEGTGVASYTRNLVLNLLTCDTRNEYILFGYSLFRKNILDNFFRSLKNKNFRALYKSILLPQSLANIVWNRLHIFPLENILGSIDVYHSSDWIQIPARARKITTVHDLIIFKYPETSHPDIINTQKKRLEHVKKECRMIVADSYSTGDDIEKILNIDRKKIKVIYPGINSEFKSCTDKQISETLKKYRIKKPYYIFVGKSEPRKNLNSVLDAYKNLTRKLKDASPSLIIAGSSGWGEEMPEFKGVIKIGDVKSSDLPALYAGALSLVFPSLYEGFGLPVIEAMACGCPVITSNRGSLKEIAADSALIVDPASVSDIAHKMKQVFTGNKLRQTLIKKGKRNALRFSWEQSAQKMINIYDSLLV